MIEPRRHHNYVLLGGVGTPQNLAEIIQVFGIANGNNNVARAHAEGFVLWLFVTINSKLIEAFRLSGTFSRNSAFGIGKQSEEHQAERNAADRRFIFREEIHDGGKEQDGRDQNYAKR